MMFQIHFSLESLLNLHLDFRTNSSVFTVKYTQSLNVSDLKIEQTVQDVFPEYSDADTRIGLDGS